MSMRPMRPDAPAMAMRRKAAVEDWESVTRIQP